MYQITEGTERRVPEMTSQLPFAAIYCRISGEDQSVFSLQTQREACLALATQRGYAVLEEYVLVDNGVSGSTLERPALRHLRELVQQQIIGAVICLDPDRLSRNLGHLILLEEEAARRGVKLLYVYFPREDTPEGKLMLSVRGAVAEYERAKILQRSWNGKVKRAQAQLPMVYGCVPYGYHLVDGRLEIEPTEAEVIRRMFAWRLEGLGVIKIVRLLTAEGVPTRADLGGGISKKTREKGVWAPSTVQRMLRNPTYVGRMAWNKRRFIEPPNERRRKERNDKRPQSASLYNAREDWIEIPCPAIIEPHVWHAVQALMDQGKATSPRRRVHDYLFLKGRLRCGKCQSAMSGFYYGKKKARFYRCSGPRQNVTIKCWNTVRADPFEEETWEAICANLLSQPEYLRIELERRQEKVSTQYGTNVDDLALIEEKIDTLLVKKRRFHHAYGDGTITLDDFKQLTAEIDGEVSVLGRLKGELQAKLDQTMRKQGEIEAAVAFIKRVNDELPVYSIQDKRRVLEILEVHVVYTDAKHSRVYFAIPAEMGIDPREFYVGDAFAAKWGYMTDSPDTLLKPGRG